MKNNFDRTKTETSKLGTRSLALLMFFVMLFTAIGSGSVLSALAVTRGDEGADDSIAESVDVSDDFASSADLYDTEETMLGVNKDLAATGAGVDLAETGATYYIWKSEAGGSTASNYTCLGASPQTFSATTGKNYYIAVSTSATSISTGTVRLDGANVSGVSTSATGTQGFDGMQGVYFAMASADTVKVSYSSGFKIKVEKGTSSSECSSDKKYIVTGSQRLTNTAQWQNSWSGAGTRNQFTYNSAIGKYELKYTNIEANSSASDTFMFRILDVTNGDDTNWGKTMGYDQGSGAISDVSNLLQTKEKNDDNNFKFSLKQKANITIYLDDSKLDTNSAIEVIVNPAVSTVTAGSAKVGSTVTPAAGTITVTNGTNVTYGGTVNLTATAGTDYVFSQWEDNSNLSYANKNAASTTATVTGSTTVNAIFVPKSYMLTRGTGTGYTITAPATASSPKQWGTDVTITANTDDMHYIDYLYYKVNNEGNEVKIGDNAGSNATTLTRTLSMPKSNVTVYASVHERESNTITYEYCTGSDGLGYINVGKRHGTSTSQIEYSIESGSKVLEGTKVLFGARPIAGKKFVGWYSNQAGTGTALSTSQDYVPATASGNYYAKFADAPDAPDTPDPLAAGSNELVLLIYAPNNSYLNLWGGYSNKNYNFGSASTTTISSTTYKVVRLSVTSSSEVKCTVHKGNNDWTTESKDLTGMYKGNTYRIYWDGTGKKSGGTKYDYTPTATPDPDKATTTYYPVKLNITNPDKGVAANTYLSNYFCASSSSVNVYAKPSDTTNMKTSIKKVSGSSDTTEVIKWSTEYSSMTMNASATSATATVTFIPKEYYKVNFSAGAGGTVAATAGGKAITSGTPVMEGTSVTITATPNSGNAVSGWTASGSLTGTSTDASRTFTVGADTTAKVYFTKSKGTETTYTYFGYGTEGNNPADNNWTFTTTYRRNGRVYAYIDSPTADTYYYFQAYDENPTTAENKIKKVYYYGKSGTNASWAVTEFPEYVKSIGRDEPTHYNTTVPIMKFKVTSDVEAVMIDLGPDDGSGNARPDLVSNTYNIIPIFNKDISKVSVYAKDASYRGDSEYDYLSGIADTVISNTTGVTNIAKQTEFETAVATKGSSITVTTTVDPNHRGRYYVRGFSVNGVTPELYEYKSSGVYSMTYNIPADFDDNYLEITPIYYRKDLSTVQFYIENYDEAFQNTGWGNTLSIYPYYQNTSNKDNAFGGYPGQPVINYGGRRFIEIPTSYNSKTIQGVTLSNDYFDIVHRDYCREVDDHLQTYDYDDFYKIYKETSDGKEVNNRTKVADQITFAFKYRTKTNNFSDNSTTQTYSNTGNTNVPAPYTSFAVSEKDTKFKNGWEPLLDYHDRPIDLFGKQLSSADQTKEPLLVVSDDYAITYAGRYATTWTVYRKDGTNYTKIKEIAPSALIVATQARLGTGTYPAVTDKEGYPTTTDHKLADYSDEYQALKAYADTPVQITYESAIRNQDGYEKHWSMTGGSSEVSKRSDGRWFYSYEGEIINADLRIDYTNEYKGEESTAWTTDTFKGNTGEVTGATVHFTNKSTDTDGPYDLEDYHDTADSDEEIVSNFNHYYKFVATEGSGYIFQGWYMERDGISTAVNPDDIKNLDGKSQMTSNATFVARYVKNPAGHITINHTMDDGSTGTGTTYIGIEKSADGSTWTWITGNGTDHFERADKVSVNDPDVMSYNSGYTLRVTLKTVVEEDTAFDRFSANNDEHSPNYFSSDVETSGTTSTTSFEVPVDDLFQIVDGFPKQQFDTLTYFSHTTKRPELTINHNLDPTSDSTAEGDTYVKVEITNSSGTVTYATYGGDDGGYAKGKDLVVPSNYFNAESNFWIKVYLKTEMKGFSQFDHFSILNNVITNAPGPHGETITLSSSTDQRTKFATSFFSAKGCYNRGERVLPYLSKLVVPDYKYELTYTYPSYVMGYGNQSYTAKDSFAPEELTEYMTLDNGDLAFQDNAKKLSFVCLKAPYENNFQKTIDYSKTTTFDERGYSSSDHTLKLGVSVNAENETLSAYFDFPYATDKDNAAEYEYVVTDGKVVKTDSNRQGKTNIYGRDWFVTNEVRHEGITGTPEFVKAPLIIYDGATPKYFKYWSVKTEGTANNASREYTRCYDYEFNLAIFQDCIITPEYDNIPFENRLMAAPVPATYNDYGRFDPDVNRDYYKTEDNGLTITFIENSRNQYNNGDAGDAPEERSGAADRLYSDFLLTYNYYDANVNYSKVILRDDYKNQKKAGMVIQPVAYMEKTADGKGRMVKSDDYYSTTTKYQGATAEQIKSYIETGTVPSGMLGGQKLQDSRFDVSYLDNKNRIQYFYGMDNAVAKTSTDDADADGILRVGEDYNNKYLVYKAFAYIGDVTGGDTLTNVVVSSRPVYFTVYKDATIQPGYYMPNTSGN